MANEIAPGGPNEPLISQDNLWSRLADYNLKHYVGGSYAYLL